MTKPDRPVVPATGKDIGQHRRPISEALNAHLTRLITTTRRPT